MLLMSTLQITTGLKGPSAGTETFSAAADELAGSFRQTVVV